MTDFLRKFILLLLIACLPLQGLAVGLKMQAQHERAGHTMVMADDMTEHDCCSHNDANPAQNSCGEITHCSLCSVTVTPGVILPLLTSGDAALYPAPTPSISHFYPEQPQRPPLASNA